MAANFPWSAGAAWTSTFSPNRTRKGPSRADRATLANMLPPAQLLRGVPSLVYYELGYRAVCRACRADAKRGDLWSAISAVEAIIMSVTAAEAANQSHGVVVRKPPRKSTPLSERL